MKTIFAIEQKPRVIFSQQAFDVWGKGWVTYYFEGAALSTTWQAAMNAVDRYYKFSVLMAMEPLTELLQ